MEKVSFEIVCPCETHVRQVMEWRNDPLTRAMSFHQEVKVLESFLEEFSERYFYAPELPSLFILANRQRIGFLAFEPVADPLGEGRVCCEVSIQLDPHFRGQGLGTAALEQIQAWILTRGYTAIYAEVKVENVNSQKMFLKAGYRFIGLAKKVLEDNTHVSIMRYLLELAPRKMPKKVFIVAEAGSNWRVGSPERDRQMAIDLIQVAAEAGADAVKFQTYRAKNLYVSNAGESHYLKSAGFEEDIYSLIQNLEMPYGMVPELVEQCARCQIEFMSTPFSKEDFFAIDPFVKRHKIASYEITHLRLLELAARSGKPLFLSTGAANEAEIAWALKIFKENGGREVTLLQCTAAYPAPVKSMNLKAIPWLAKRFKVPSGLSDHSAHPLYAPIAAVALGATVIEKHFTMDRRLSGPDHGYAIEPQELKDMVLAIRETEKMRGEGFKTPQADEDELRLFVKRGLQATTFIPKGTCLEEGVNIDILRPGNQKQGIHSRFLPSLIGKKSTRDIPEGDGLQQGDWE